MKRKLSALVLLLCLVDVSACKKKEAAPPSVPAETTAAQAAPPAPVASQPAATLPAGAPIPSTGVALWLVADDAKGDSGGRLASWSSNALPAANATAGKPELQPTLVPNVLNGHAVVRFDG